MMERYSKQLLWVQVVVFVCGGWGKWSMSGWFIGAFSRVLGGDFNMIIYFEMTRPDNLFMGPMMLW